MSASFPAPVADAQDLLDIRRDSIFELALAQIVVAWVVATMAIGYNGQIAHLLVAALLLAGAAGSIWLRQRSIYAAFLFLIATLLVSIGTYKWFAPQSMAQFALLLLVAVGGIMVSRRGIYLIATAAALTCLGVARAQGAGWLDGVEIIAPVLLIYITAFGAWISARQVNMTLGWLRFSYSRADELVEALRDERLSRALRALEGAYEHIERINADLTEANSQAQEARLAKARFAANISHELRTPLNIIIGFSETMANAPESYAA